MLRGKVPLAVGATVERDGFAYADLLPENEERLQARA